MSEAASEPNTEAAMNIGAIGGAGMPSFDPSQMQARRDQMIDTVAQGLGISADELASQLNGGASLAEVARAKGVGRAELTEMISVNAPGGMTPPAGMVNQLIDSEGLRPPNMEQMKAQMLQGLQGLGGGDDIASLLDRLMQGEDRNQVRAESGVDARAFTDLLQRSFGFNALA